MSLQTVSGSHLQRAPRESVERGSWRAAGFGSPQHREPCPRGDVNRVNAVAAHSQQQDERDRRQRRPDAAAEIRELGTCLLVIRRQFRLERHAADWTGAGAGLAHLRVHRAEVHRGRRGWRGRRARRHACRVHAAVRARRAARPGRSAAMPQKRARQRSEQNSSVWPSCSVRKGVSPATCMPHTGSIAPPRCVKASSALIASAPAGRAAPSGSGSRSHAPDPDRPPPAP